MAASLHTVTLLICYELLFLAAWLHILLEGLPPHSPSRMRLGLVPMMAYGLALLGQIILAVEPTVALLLIEFVGFDGADAAIVDADRSLPGSGP